MYKIWLFLTILMLSLPGHGVAAPGFMQYSKPAFETAAQEKQVILVHVYADWCSICQKQLPGLTSALEDSALSKVKAMRVNFDADRDFLMTHRIPNQSVILVFKDGKEVLRLNGVTNAEQIKSKIKSVL